MVALRVLPLGPPGAGKGTQSRRIAKEYDIPHISTGDMLRANKDMETDHGTPREYMEAGELVPDDVMEAVVEEALDGRDGFILDGYPRTIRQADHLAEAATLNAVIYLSVDRDELIDRLSGRRTDPETGKTYHVEFNMPDDPTIADRLIRREDDAPEQVERRLDVYEENTKAVIEYYQDHDGFVEIDGEGTPEAVWNRIKSSLDTHV